MTRIMLSVRPEWVAKILNGEKTIEIRKTAPKCDLPIDVYIYCTKGDYLHINRNGCFVSDLFHTVLVSGKKQPPLNGKVVAKFTLRKVEGVMYLPLSLGLDERRKRGCYSCVFEDSVKPNFDKEDYSDYFTEASDDNHLVFCLKMKGSQIHDYLKGKKGYAWHISDLEIFDYTKDLYDFGLTRAPQSWCYVEERE